METDNGTTTVIVTADTKVQHPIGLGARKKEVGQEVLIPGLKLKFEGTGDENQVTAEKITFDQDDLSIAKVIQAGLNPTAQQQARNMQTYEGQSASYRCSHCRQQTGDRGQQAEDRIERTGHPGGCAGDPKALLRVDFLGRARYDICALRSR